MVALSFSEHRDNAVMSPLLRDSVCCPDMKRTEPFYQRNARLTTGNWSRNLRMSMRITRRDTKVIDRAFMNNPDGVEIP